jgi:hypothetical protein
VIFWNQKEEKVQEYTLFGINFIYQRWW